MSPKKSNFGRISFCNFISKFSSPIHKSTFHNNKLINSKNNSNSNSLNFENHNDILLFDEKLDESIYISNIKF